MDISELIPNARVLTTNKTQELETAVVARQTKLDAQSPDKKRRPCQKRLYLSTRRDNQELCQ